MGHCAKFCAYTAMHVGSDLIPDFELRQSSESKSSVSMERDACGVLQPRLKDQVGMNRICTDRSSSVSKLIRTKFNDVSHEFDPWHMAKNLHKKLFCAFEEEKL